METVDSAQQTKESSYISRMAGKSEKTQISDQAKDQNTEEVP